MPDPVIKGGLVAYGRLSRGDERDKTTPIADKVLLRKQVLIEFARREADVEISDENIVFELKSGGDLVNRPGLTKLAEQCHQNEISTLIIQDIDRLVRDLGDWLTLEKAFFKAKLRLITCRGEYLFDRHLDTTMLRLYAMFGEQELRKFCLRRVITNSQRARNGHLSQGYAPYGYNWDAVSKQYTVDADEYPVVCEIFRRIRFEGCGAIAKHLNAAGITPPGIGHRFNASQVWLQGTIAGIVRNPFYTGRTARRSEADREHKVVKLPENEWIWSDRELDYPHPITKDEWKAICNHMSSRRIGHPTKSALSPVLRCSAGKLMHGHGVGYSCKCAIEGNPHPSTKISKAKIETAIIRIIADRLSAIPPERLNPKKKPTTKRQDLEREHAKLLRQIEGDEASRNTMMLRTDFFLNLPDFGQAKYESTLQKLSENILAAKTRVAELEALLVAVDVPKVRSIAVRIAELGGIESVFESAPPELKRQIVSSLIHTVQLRPPSVRSNITKFAQVTLRPLVDDEPGLVFDISLRQASLGKPRGSAPWRSKPRTRKPKSED